MRLGSVVSYATLLALTWFVGSMEKKDIQMIVMVIFNMDWSQGYIRQLPAVVDQSLPPQISLHRYWKRGHKQNKKGNPTFPIQPYCCGSSWSYNS